MKDYDYSKKLSQTVVHDWAEGQEGAMKQYSNGSMDYYEKKGKLDKEDTKKIERSGLPQM